MVNPKEARGLIYYVDRDGVVHGKPTKSLEELTIPSGVRVDDKERGVQRQEEAELQKLGAILVESSILGSSVRKASRVARRLTIGHYLPGPGLINIGDGSGDCYTGWFHVANNNGETVPLGIHRSGGQRPIRHPDIERFRPYFIFSTQNEAKGWDVIMRQRKLGMHELSRLIRVPHEDAHPLFGQLANQGQEEFLAEAKSSIDGFWDQLRALEAKESSDAQIAEHARSNVLKLVVFNSISKKRHEDLRLRMEERMNSSGVFFLRLTPTSALVGYTDNGKKFKSRTLPFPPTLLPAQVGLFKRYCCGECPLTYSELRYRYGLLIDPTNRLFD